MDKQINIVYSTMDYDKFSFLDGNRPVNPNGRPDLNESISKRSLERPIDVNEDFAIIDGQNRFTTWKIQKKPIVYIIHKHWGIDEVAILNSNQKNWIAKDFVNAYIEQGITAYVKFKAFDDKWGFGTPVNLMLLCGGKATGSDIYEVFKAGDLKITSELFAEESARKLNDFKDIYVGYKRTKFVTAMVMLFRLRDYNHKTMMHKMKYLSRRLVHCATTTEYFELLKELYNYKAKEGTTKL